MDDKRLVLILKTGPAFDAEEIQAAHKALDEAGTPRMEDERTLTLSERIRRMSVMHEALILTILKGRVTYGR